MLSTLDNFRQTHVYTSDATAAEVVRDLNVLRTMGENINAVRKRCGSIFFILLVPSIIVLVVGISFARSYPIPVAIALLAVNGTCVFALLGLIRYSRLSYELKLAELAQKTLAAISRDMSPDAKVAVHIDLRPHNHQAKFKREGTANGWKVKYYADPWLKLTGRFLDGSVFRLVAITHYQKRSRWKKGRSGKTKLKSKSKESTIFALRLRFKKKKYPNVERITQTKAAIQLPQGVTVRKLVTAADSIFLSTRLSFWDTAPASNKPGAMTSGVHTVAMMFLSVYQVLNLARAIVKSGK